MTAFVLTAFLLAASTGGVAHDLRVLRFSAVRPVGKSASGTSLLARGRCEQGTSPGRSSVVQLLRLNEDIWRG